MHRSYLQVFAAAALLTASSVPAAAQQQLLQKDKVNLQRSDEAKKNDADFDQQFRARRDSGQADNTKADPWSGVRTQTPQPETAKKPKN